MNNKLQLSNNKTLKLSNVLMMEIDIGTESDNDFNKQILKMENYIKSKGAMPIGPLIQKTEYSINEEGQLAIKIYLMRQSNNYINHLEEPYKMESIIRVKDCMYVRYTGPENKLKFAYDKINLTAFEEDIELSNENYTIFVNQIDEDIVADVFVEKIRNE